MSKIKINTIKSRYTEQELWDMLSKMYNNKMDKNKELIKEVIIKYIEDIFDNKEFNQNIAIQQGCKTNGIVSRSGLDLNLCNDPTCSSCNMFNELLKEEAKNFLNENT